MLDVAIIGAGPVGLATAAALMKKLGTDAHLQVVYAPVTEGYSLSSLCTFSTRILAAYPAAIRHGSSFICNLWLMLEHVPSEALQHEMGWR